MSTRNFYAVVLGAEVRAIKYWSELTKHQKDMAQTMSAWSDPARYVYRVERGQVIHRVEIHPEYPVV